MNPNALVKPEPESGSTFNTTPATCSNATVRNLEVPNEEHGPAGRTPREALALAIRAARERAGLSQQELADAADLNLRTVEDTEEDRTEPKWGTLRKIARSAGTPLEQLLEEAEELE